MTYLRAACLILSPKRGRYLITSKGKQILDFGITELSQKDLCNISPEFEAFLHGKKLNATPSEESETISSTPTLSPSETIDEIITQINASLSTELLAQIKNQTPGFFEQLVLDLLVKMGYGGNREDAAMVTKISHDGGIDGIIKEDRLGLDMIYIFKPRDGKTPFKSPKFKSSVEHFPRVAQLREFLSQQVILAPAQKKVPKMLKLFLLTALNFAAL